MADYFTNKTVLVTGADGFIGSHLCEALVAQGAQVTALVQYNSFGGNGWLDDIAPALREGVSIRRGDIRDAAFVRSLVSSQQVIFHLAALIAIPYSYEAAQSYVDVNVTGTLNVLEACRQHTPERIVHTSTSEVYGTAQVTPISETHPLHGQSPYAASKIGADMMAEAYARSFELPVFILRPFNTFGPRQSERAVIPTIIRQIIDPECASIRLGSLTPRRDFNYVADTVSAFLALGAARDVTPGWAYNAGSGIAVTIGEVVTAVLDLTGANKNIETESARTRPKQSEVMDLLANPRRLQAATGWRSSYGLRDGLARTIDWWRRELNAGRLRSGTGYLT